MAERCDNTCKKRKVGCRKECPIWKKYKEKMAKVKKAEEEERAYLGYVSDASKRMRGRNG